MHKLLGRLSADCRCTLQNCTFSCLVPLCIWPSPFHKQLAFSFLEKNPAPVFSLPLRIPLTHDSAAFTQTLPVVAPHISFVRSTRRIGLRTTLLSSTLFRSLSVHYSCPHFEVLCPFSYSLSFQRRHAITRQKASLRSQRAFSFLSP